MLSCQSAFIYFPMKGGEAELLQLAQAKGLHPWRDEKGALIGWAAGPDQADRPVAVVFHGNAGMALHRTYYTNGLRTASGGRWRVSILEYPGYGARTGTPAEEQMYSAAREALTLLLREKPQRLYLIGESLGTGVACRMAQEFPNAVTGMLLVTPFTSLFEAAAYHYPKFLVRIALSERYDNQNALERYQGPVAFLLAGRDEIIPSSLGKTLYDNYHGPKLLQVQEESGHNNLDLSPNSEWWSRVVSFLESHEPL